MTKYAGQYLYDGDSWDDLRIQPEPEIREVDTGIAAVAHQIVDGFVSEAKSIRGWVSISVVVAAIVCRVVLAVAT